jgi:hypothetical protein
MVQKAVEREFARKSGWRKHAGVLVRATTLPPRVRIVLAWLLVWGLYGGLALLAVVYGRLFGPNLTQIAIASWGFAWIQTVTYARTYSP